MGLLEDLISFVAKVGCATKGRACLVRDTAREVFHAGFGEGGEDGGDVFHYKKRVSRHQPQHKDYFQKFFVRLQIFRAKSMPGQVWIKN